MIVEYFPALYYAYKVCCLRPKYDKTLEHLSAVQLDTILGFYMVHSWHCGYVTFMCML